MVGLCSELRALRACQGQAGSQWEVPVGAFVVYPLVFTQCYLGNVLLCSRLSSRAAQMFWFPKALNMVFLFVSLFALSMGNKRFYFFCFDSNHVTHLIYSCSLYGYRVPWVFSLPCLSLEPDLGHYFYKQTL